MLVTSPAFGNMARTVKCPRDRLAPQVTAGNLYAVITYLSSSSHMDDGSAPGFPSFVENKGLALFRSIGAVTVPTWQSFGFRRPEPGSKKRRWVDGVGREIERERERPRT